MRLPGQGLIASVLGMPAFQGHPYDRKRIKRSVPSWRGNRYAFEQGGPPPRRSAAVPLCHVPAVRRPDSFELGGMKGNNGLAPGASGFGPGLHDMFAHDTGARACEHPACVGDVRARRRKAGR